MHYNTFTEWWAAFLATHQLWFESRRSSARYELIKQLAGHYTLLTDYCTGPASEPEKLDVLQQVFAIDLRGNTFAWHLPDPADFVARLGPKILLLAYTLSHNSGPFFRGLGERTLTFAQALSANKGQSAFYFAVGISKTSGQFFIGMPNIRQFAEGLGPSSYFFAQGLDAYVFTKTFPGTSHDPGGSYGHYDEELVHTSLLESFMRGLGPHCLDFARGITARGTQNVEAFLRGISEEAHRENKFVDTFSALGNYLPQFLDILGPSIRIIPSLLGERWEQLSQEPASACFIIAQKIKAR